MNLALYDSLNEKLRICYSHLNGNDLKKSERQEIEREAHLLKRELMEELEK